MPRTWYVGSSDQCSSVKHWGSVWVLRGGVGVHWGSVWVLRAGVGVQCGMVGKERTGGKPIVLNMLYTFVGCWRQKWAELTSLVHRSLVMTWSITEPIVMSGHVDSVDRVSVDLVLGNQGLPQVVYHHPIFTMKDVEEIH